jgi:hypothetical protein
MRTKFWLEFLKVGDLLEELEEGGRVHTGPLAGFCEHGDERAGFIQAAEFVDKLNDYQLLSTGSVPCTVVPDCSGAD